ncbi:MAG: hypothetical protein AMXMBFR82_28820 [Candidatus Hydrogenedentota bacterium]
MQAAQQFGRRPLVQSDAPYQVREAVTDQHLRDFRKSHGVADTSRDGSVRHNYPFSGVRSRKRLS